MEMERTQNATAQYNYYCNKAVRDDDMNVNDAEACIRGRTVLKSIQSAQSSHKISHRYDASVHVYVCIRTCLLTSLVLRCACVCVLHPSRAATHGLFDPRPSPRRGQSADPTVVGL